MSLANLKVAEELTKETDSVGSRILESDIYDFTIDTAYIGTSSGGATSLNLQLVTDSGQEFKTTIYVSSGTAKGCKPTYTDKKSGEEKPLPGFLQGNAICLLTIGKPIHTLETEEKVIKLYNHDAKEEIPTKVAMAVDLLGQKISMGIIKQTADKNVKNDQGVYVPSGDTKDENEEDKCFRAGDYLTTAEIRAGETEADFKDKWLTKNKGVTKMKAKSAGAGTGTTAGAPAKAAASAPNLFA